MPIAVETHKTKNFSRGVINCYDLKDLTDEEIADGLGEYGVVTAQKPGEERRRPRPNG